VSDIPISTEKWPLSGIRFAILEWKNSKFLARNALAWNLSQFVEAVPDSTGASIKVWLSNMAWNNGMEPPKDQTSHEIGLEELRMELRN
jgi:hypothetical protein